MLRSIGVKNNAELKVRVRVEVRAKVRVKVRVRVTFFFGYISIPGTTARF
jgi:hypothetical protein